jgi:ribosomal protein S6--L-glutamate ligase
MRLTILSRSSTIPSTRRMADAAREKGHKVRVLNPTKVELHLDGRAASIFYKRKRLKPPDVVIPRIAPSVSSYGLAVVEQFAMRGAQLMNTARAIGQSRNPMRCLQLLSAAGVDIPATVMAREAADLKAMVDLVGGVPVLVKLLQGQERRGVMVCETLQSLEAALEAVLGLGHNLVVQQYVKTRGADVRVFVVGGQALCAVRRHPRTGRLRRSLTKGARLEKMELTPAHRSAAETSARLCDLEICAVDMLDVKGGPKVFEINSSPTITEMETATGVDLASAIIARAEQLHARNRLRAVND